MLILTHKINKIKKMLQVNSKAPIDIKILNEKSEEVTLKDYLKISKIVLYLYPKDNTSGCTKEACTFTILKEEFQKINYQIIGLSKDSPSSHQKFIKKYSINFPLLSDENHILIDKLGCFGEKTLYGRKYLGTIRSTFVINQKGIITHTFEKITPNTHAKEILDILKNSK